MNSKEYELFVKTILEGISRESGDSISNILHNHAHEGNSGRKWKVDLSYTFSYLNLNHKVFVECKCWNKPVDVNVISLLHECLKDCGANKGAVATTKNFTKGAQDAANSLGIGMIIVSDYKEPEFHNFTGNENSFDQANNSFHLFTANSETKIISGVVHSKKDFLEYINQEAGSVAEYVLRTQDQNYLLKLSTEEVVVLDQNIENAIEKLRNEEMCGLPLEFKIDYNYDNIYYVLKMLSFDHRFDN